VSRRNGFEGWLVSAVGAIVVALVTAWALHWIGPSKSPSVTAPNPTVVPQDTGGHVQEPRASEEVSDRTPQLQPASASLEAEDIVGKWLHPANLIVPSNRSYWLIRPSEEGYVIDPYDPDGIRIKSGTGRVVGNEFVFALKEIQEGIAKSKFIYIDPDQTQGRLRIVDGTLAGPTDQLDSDKKKAITITLTRE
jgi:hypothetical protein